MIIDFKEIPYLTSNENLGRLFNNAVFIDIETTGLSRIHADIISVTLLLYLDNSYKIYQIFCEYKIDEPEALKYLKELIINKKYIVTYNGNSFDIPFLANKFQKYNIESDMNSFTKIDLYILIRPVRNRIQVENLKLKTVEGFFNIEREDTLLGEDIITLYNAYRIEPRKEFSFLILQHNYEDVLNLPILFEHILNLYDDVLYYNNLIVTLNYSDFKIKKNSLICILSVIADCKHDYVHTSLNFNLRIDYKSQSMELDIPLGFFTDEKIKEFYFIDNNNYKIKSYTAIEGIKRNLMPIKFNGKIFDSNMVNVVKNILSSITF